MATVQPSGARTLAVVALAASLVGCAMMEHRAQVRSGLLTLGLHREAFLREWGLPTRTATMSGEQVTQASFGGNSFGGGGFFFSGKRTYEIWTYSAPEGEVVLAFSGVRLAGWTTKLTTKELQ